MPIAQRLGVPYPAVVAHRGASYYAPEETEPAFLLAREIGADYLELDVQRTKDGVLIALHDDSPARTTDAAEVFPGRENDTVDKFTYLELTKLDAGSWFNTAYPGRAREAYEGLKILTLAEVIDIAEGGEHQPGLYIETKAADRFPGIEKQLVEMLEKRGWIAEHEGVPGKARVIFQSFDGESLTRLKELAPQVPRIYLIEHGTEHSQWAGILKEAHGLEAGLGPSGNQVWSWYTGPAHNHSLLVHHYTLNKKWQMWLANQFGSDGIITDRPDTALIFYDRVGAIDLDAIFQTIGY